MKKFHSKPQRDTALLVHYIDAELERLTAQAGRSPDADPDRPVRGSVRLYDSAEVNARLACVEHARAETEVNVREFLHALVATPSLRALSPQPALSQVLALANEFPNFSDAAHAVASAVALARLTEPTSPRWWPLLLVGEPGIGKSAFAERLAEVLGVPAHRFGFGHATAGFSLGGLDSQYSTGGPGWLARTVALGDCADPVIVLDEIDKCPSNGGSDPLGPLYSLWDGTSERFVDDGLKIPLNFSRLRWIATCNDTGGLTEALLSRCLIVEVKAPSEDQSIAIARRIYRRLVGSTHQSEAFAPELSDDAARKLATLAPREVEKALQLALGRAALAGRRRLDPSDFDLPGRPSRRSIGFQP